jgi:NADH dehydrogenase
VISPYDYLVIATGSTTNFFGNKEIEKHAMPMKSIPEALNLRYLILQNLEEASLKLLGKKKNLTYPLYWLAPALPV